MVVYPYSELSSSLSGDSPSDLYPELPLSLGLCITVRFGVECAGFRAPRFFLNVRASTFLGMRMIPLNRRSVGVKVATLLGSQLGCCGPKTSLGAFLCVCVESVTVDCTS